jgi:hypothetical protein
MAIIVTVTLQCDECSVELHGHEVYVEDSGYELNIDSLCEMAMSFDWNANGTSMLCHKCRGGGDD